MPSAELRKEMEKTENKRKVEEAIEEVNAQNQLEDGCGGDIKLFEITDENVIRVRLMGECMGCPTGPDATLISTIPAALKRKKATFTGVFEVP